MSATSISGRHGVPSLSTVISPGGQRAGDEIVEHEIEPQPVGHAAGGREAQAGDRHLAGVACAQRVLPCATLERA